MPAAERSAIRSSVTRNGSRDDVIEGFVSVEAARTEYGVSLDSSLAVDEDATRELRGRSR